MGATSKIKMEFGMRMARHVIFREIMSGCRKNLLLSPLSLQFMLNLVASGSLGRSFDQLLSFLESESIGDLNKQASQIMAIPTSERSSKSSSQESVSGQQGPFSSYSLSGISGPSSSEYQTPLVGFVNGLWVDHRFPLKESFKEIAKDVYNVEVRTIDFITQVPLSDSCNSALNLV